jgi:lipopolysaccharide biosynthesis glycosyltransferase
LKPALPIFIGYDPREAAAYHACVQSIIDTARDPMNLHFTPVTGPMRDGSNAFIYARFLIPYLCGYSGVALFLDGDMIVRSPIEDLFAHTRLDVGVCVVKHDYKTKHPVKYLGNKNEDYPRKNWSSVVLWNCGYFPNRVLDPEYVATKSGSFLHRFAWLSDHQIGDLPQEWNKLVLEQTLEQSDKLRHFTIGTPCFQEYMDCDGAEEWHATYKRMIAPL